jgi:SAM-dependent methyltransferase
MQDAAPRASPMAPSAPADPSATTSATATAQAGMGLDSIRLQAEEHPVIEDAPATSSAEHCLRLMHLKAYAEAALHAAGAAVLDVGCNTGYGTLGFLGTARRIVGVDVSERAIEVARAAAPDGRPEFLVIDGITLPFDDDTFDLVVSFQVIEHIEDPVPYLREIRRVARPAATVLFTTPNAGTRLYPGMTPWNRFHVREYLAPELEDALREVFPDAKVRGMFGTPTLYETEIRRVGAARERIRKAEATAAAPGPAPTAASARGTRRRLPVRLVKAVIPTAIRARLRGALVDSPPPVPKAVKKAPPPGPEPMPLEHFLEFTVDDLYYADHDLDRAMDFMAVCRA